MNAKTYLSDNHIVDNFIQTVNKSIADYYEINLPSLKCTELEVSVGNKYIKLSHNRSVWGFISRYDGMMKGFPIKKGDLLKPASYNSPAAHSRGNIIDGSAKYNVYGPNYLK